MYCPNCGTNNSTEQSFCRSCGINLEQTVHSLIEQVPTTKSTELQIGERRLEKLGKIAFGGMGFVGLAAVIGMIYTIFVKFILSGTGVISGVIFILLLIFAVLGLAFVIVNETLKEKKLKATNPHIDIEPILETPNTGKLLKEKPFEPVPSVVEDTTDLLPIERKDRIL